MADDTLCLSDVVCLYSRTTDGYVFSSQSSSAYNEVVVGSTQDKQSSNIRDPKQFLFEICVAGRYKANKALKKLEVKTGGDKSHPLHNQLQKAQAEAEIETRDNELKQKVHQGKKLLYGQVIQLKHTLTQKFLHVNMGNTSLLEGNNLVVLLLNFNAKNAQFKVMSKFSSKTEGDVVEAGEQVAFESVKWPGHYLHVSKSTFDGTSVYRNCHELNVSLHQSSFKITRKSKLTTDENKCFKAGDIVRLLHTEMEGYLVAEGLFDRGVTEDVHLRLCPGGKYKSRHKTPSSSAITYWQIELQEGPLSEGTLQRQKKCRLLHMCTRQYLCVTQDGTTGLTVDASDHKTLFRFHPYSMDHDNVPHESSCMIEHAVSRQWLHGSTDKYKPNSETMTEGKKSPVGSLKWSNAQLRQIKLVEDQHKEDVFTLQSVDSELVNTFYYISGMIPFLDKLLKDKRDGVTLDSDRSTRTCKALKEINEFMLENGKPVKKRQKLLRNLQIINIFIKLLGCPNNRSDAQYMTLIFEEIYEVLHTFLRGHSIKNKLFIAKYLDFIMTQCKVEGGNVSKKAACVITKAIKNNKKIVEKFTRDDVDKVAGMLLAGMNYRHLDLLDALCVCSGEYIAENQTLIASVWLGDTQNYVYLTKLVNERNYVSTNRGKDWIDFTTLASRGDEDEEYKFLLRQLNLYCDICRGQPDIVNMVTEVSKYFTFEEAQFCLRLTEPRHPDKIRRVACRLMLAMFVDIVDNISVVDHVSHCYVYDDIVNHKDLLCPVDNSEYKTGRYFAQLNRWIGAFLKRNTEMVYSDVENNIVITEVLNLVKYLVKYGFYWGTEQIKTILDLLLDLLKGYTDRPSLNVEDEDLIQFRQIERFKASKQAEAVFEAKVQALEILNLLLKQRPKSRIEGFLWHFKTEINTESGMNLSKFKDALQKNDQAAGISVLLDQDNLITMLQDLMRYQSDAVIQKSLLVLNGWFSAEEVAFSGCLRAQILRHPDSVQLYHDVQDVVRMAKRPMKDEARELAEIMKKMASYCCLKDDKEEPHEINQSILVNCGILEDAIAILGTSVDVHDIPNLRILFRKTFTMLKCLAKENPMVHRRLFEHIDLFLGINGCVVEMTELLVEIFTRNTYTKLKVTPQHVQKVMELIKLNEAEANHYLGVLLAIVRVDGFDVPVRKNQNLIMNCLMQNDTEITRILFTDSETRMRTLLSRDTREVSIYLSLVELLARCAEAENRFNQKICRTILTVPEVLAILNRDNVSIDHKTPFVHFLNNVYLQTVKGKEETIVERIHQDPNMWNYIHTVASGTFDTLVEYCRKHKQNTTRMLGKLSSFSGSSSDEKVLIKSTLKYLFEAVFPMLQNFIGLCCTRDQNQFPNGLAQAGSLLPRFKSLVDVLLPLVPIETQRSSLVLCLTVISTLAGVKRKDTVEYLGQFQLEDIDPNRKSKARKKYEDKYKNEIEINRRLQALMTDLKSTYFDKDEELHFGLPCGITYSDVNCEYEAPLGDEFRKLVNVFIDPEAISLDMKYMMADNIVRQLSLSSKRTSLVGSEKEEQRALDIKCMQILRKMVHMAVEENQDDIGQAQAIQNIQDMLNSFGEMFGVIDHLARPDDVIVNEILAFLLTLLFNGNSRVQKVLYDYLEGPGQKTFVQVMYKTLCSTTEHIRDRRNLRSLFLAKVEELNTLEDTLKRDTNIYWVKMAIAPMRRLLMKSITSMKMSLANLQKAPKPSREGYTSQVGKQSVGTKLAMIMTNEVTPKMWLEMSKRGDPFSINNLRLAIEDFSSMKEDARAELVLSTLGAVCGQQNTGFQDMFREKPLTVNSMSLIEVTAKCVDVLVDGIDSNSIDLLTQVFDTLTRFSTGNQKNQKIIFNHRICEHVLQVLRLGSFQGCSDLQVYSLKRSIGALLGRLAGENSGDPMESLSSEDVMGCIDAEILVSTMTDAYTDNKVKKASAKKLRKEVMFRFYQLLARKCDIDHNVKVEAILNTTAKQCAFDYCADHTHSVELLKDNTLQRLYFTMTDTGVLRDEVKEKFESAVDRSSPGNKIHDFMDWARDITHEARRLRRIRTYRLGRFILCSWTFFNYAVYLLSLMIAMTLIVSWVERESDNDVRPDFQFHDSYKTFLVFAGIHNLLSIIVFIGYILMYRPTFPKMSNMKAITRESKEDGIEKGHAVSEEKTRSHLEVKIYDVRTIYYFLFLACSGAGTGTFGYFFAFHLLHVIELNRTLRRVLQAVTVNGCKLISVAILGVVVFYIFSLILFAFYRDPVWLDERYCRNIYECYVSIVHYGFVGGPYMLNSTGMDITFGQQIGIMTFDLSFFVLVTILGLYIILGIIVDGFMQLRDTKLKVEKDKQTSCFICSRHRMDFEKHLGAQSFQRHITEEHNLWSYIYFIIHLDETRPCDYSALESYVYKMLTSENYSFFPKGRAICLESYDSLKETEFDDGKGRLEYEGSRVERQVVISEHDAGTKKHKHSKHMLKVHRSGTDTFFKETQ